MTFENSLHAQPKAFEKAVFQNSLFSIFRTCGVKPAYFRERFCNFLVKINKKNRNFFHYTAPKMNLEFCCVAAKPPHNKNNLTKI